MTREEQIRYLTEHLLAELPEYGCALPADPEEQRRLLRGLMNVRPPLPLDPDFLAVQDALLSAEAAERGPVAVESMPETGVSGVRLWQGDITRIAADAIVNAANSALLGCFVPGHACIDNAIHSAAGLQLRDECSRLMLAQGHAEPTGRAKLTGGYNLPAKHVLHTVGPIVGSVPGEADRAALRSCYESCLALAAENGLASVAFCCISTGEFHYPNREAAGVAVSAVREFLPRHAGMTVVFNVFKNVDLALYRELLGPAR